MAPVEYHRNLKRRKEALLVESDLNRLVLRLELENLRNSTSRVDTTLNTARRLGPWLLPLVSVVGMLAGRRARKGASRLGWIPIAVRYIPMLLRLRKTRASEE